MKIFTFTLGLAILSPFIQAQTGTGIDAIIVEKYYVANAADVTNSINQGAVIPLVNGQSVTYRVYVDMAAGYKFSLLKGNSNHPLIIKTTTDFYNDPNNGVVIGAQATSTLNVRKNTVMIDSWLTTGGVAVGKIGVIEGEDTDGSLGNAQSILANNPGGIYGDPLNGVNAKDGFLPGTTLSPTTLGFGGAGSASDVFDQSAGGTFSVTNGAMSALGGTLGYGPNNIILIGQFTTDGVFSFEMNIQLIKPGGTTADEYVANNPIGTETAFQGLIYPNVTTNNKETIKETPSVISLYPNPTNNSFVIDINNSEEITDGVLSIYDVKGMLVTADILKTKTGELQHIVDLSKSPSGLYFVTLSINGKLTTKKIIKE
jgi:hypothetical protein